MQTLLQVIRISLEGTIEVLRNILVSLLRLSQVQRNFTDRSLLLIAKRSILGLNVLEFATSLPLGCQVKVALHITPLVDAAVALS